MTIKLLLGSMAVLTLGMMAACGDDTTSTSATTGTTTTTTTTSSSGTGGAGGGGGAGGAAACELPGVAAPADCAEACAAVYDCGALECDGMTGCAFTGEAAEKAAFVGDAAGGCIQGCMAQPLLVNLVDPSSCDTTITTIKGASADFAASCDNGISGAGGAGGAGGGGGAGGN